MTKCVFRINHNIAIINVIFIFSILLHMINSFSSQKQIVKAEKKTGIGHLSAPNLKADSSLVYGE